MKYTAEQKLMVVKEEQKQGFLGAMDPIWKEILEDMRKKYAIEKLVDDIDAGTVDYRPTYSEDDM